MTILLVQTFLLLLGAFLLGASLACLIRRGFSASRDDVMVTPAPSPQSNAAPAVAAAAAAAGGSDRFGRALTGPEMPPVFQPGEPVVEVQPRLAPQPSQSAAPQPAPQPAAPQPSPPPAPPQRDAMPAPAPRPAPAPSPPPQPAVASAPPAQNQAAPQPARPAEESYTQVAVAAAAAAAALAAAKAREEAAAKDAAAKAAPESDAAAAARKATAAKLAVTREEETGPSRFGTTIVPMPHEPTTVAPVDDLTRIHGIDVELKERLVRYGIHRFSAIAAWTPEDVRAVNQSLGFQGRVERENWVEQARILASGGTPAAPPKTEPPPVVPAPVDGDRLHRVIGIDPQSEALLRANGVTKLDDIAGWSADDVARFEALLGVPGRIEREGWVEQARFLTGRAAPAPEPEPVPAEEATASASQGQPRSESYATLRSVRSEALRGESAVGVTTGIVEDLKRIRGIGVLIEKKLHSLGITSYEQVANWTRADIDRISQLLDFKGRIERENWIEQARILASGGQTEFSRRVDRGEA